MKKILFISVRDPFSGRYSGDVIRAEKFISYLSKKNYVDVISLGKDNNKFRKKNLRVRTFLRSNFLQIFLNFFLSIIKLKPIHFNLFYSSKINKFVKKQISNYDVIFCHSIRAFQYIPKNIKKKIILDMGDLYSKNYHQTYENLSYINPLKIIYFIESKIVEKYEKYCFEKANKIFLFSKSEINLLNNKEKKKLVQIDFGVEKFKNFFKYEKKNFKILFIGNINYTPNKKACFDFIEKILPKIKLIYPEIEFHIIGEVNEIDRYFLKRKNGVKILGKVENLQPHLRKVICGIANLNISTGVQTKILTYMSYGIPCIASEKVFKNFDKIKNGSICHYKNDQELIELIIKLKEEKDFSKNLSKKSLKNIRYFLWKNVLKIFDKLI